MNYRSTIVLLVLLAVVGGLVYFFELRNPEPASTDASASKQVQVLSLNSDNIDTITVQQGSQTVVVKKGDDGKWSVDQPEKMDADQSQVTNVALQLAHLSADRMIEEKASDLTGYGLDSPQWEVIIGVKGSDPQTLLVGSGNPNGASLYVKRSSDDTVYLLSTYSLNSLKGWLTAPPKFVPTPTPMPVTPEPAAPASATPSATPAP